MEDNKIPLGLCKQAVMKLDSFNTDISEILEDDDIDEKDREDFMTMKEMADAMIAVILNIIEPEYSEEDFMNENIAIDDIDPYPDFINDDILDMNIE